MSSTHGDLYRHGTSLVVMAKSDMSGLAQASTAVSLKITDWETRYFTEKSFVEAIEYAFNDPVVSTITKIINFSGAFEGGNSNVANCAIQWAFYRGIAVIAAAGNKNTLINAINPYLLTVGSFGKPVNGLGSVWSQSNFGPEIDIWAPNEFISPFRVGTSIGTGFVSSAAAIAVSLYPAQLRSKPELIFNYLKSNADNNLVAISDKTTKTLHKRALSIKSFATATPSTATSPEPTNNYCGHLNLGLDKKTPNWTALKNAASNTKIGQIVTQSSTVSCTSRYTRC
jgi:hypothetical protein